MHVERLLQVSMAALVTLGTLLLGMGERNMLLPLLAFIVAVSSVYLTDVKGWLQLNTTLANVAAIAALWMSVRELDALHSERQLVSMANLLIYLQFVLMYRRKTVRGYWMLAILSLLQVAVAAALNLSIVFGFLLVLYMFMGLLTLALFFLYRELADQEASAGPGGDEPTRGQGDRRWPLAAVPAGFSGRTSGDTQQPGLVWALFRQVARLSVVSLLLAVVVFFVLPRLGNTDRWRTRPGGTYRVIGFSESVTLGELGEAYENPGEVMQVELFDHLTGEPYRLGDQPLFRGALLQTYDRGRWSRRGGHGEKPRMPIAEELPPNEDLVRQVIRAAPLDDDTLFCVAPSFLVSAGYESNKYLCYSERTEQILRHDEAERILLKFELVTIGLRDHFTSNISVATRKPRQDEINQMLDLPKPEGGPDPMVGLKAVAVQRVSQIPAGRERWAQSLTAYLRDSGSFSYSLTPVTREKTLDPVEDFVTRNRIGHCEYFASALTLMLRSVGIPARMAVGFKGGEWNNIGRFYQVRQLHAHTWVEAYLEDINDLPLRLRGSPMARNNGAWLTLDPTPATVDEEPGFGEYAFNQLADFSQYIWSNYIMGMDAQRQQEDIYQPVVQSVEATLERLADAESRREMMRGLLGSDPRGWTWTDGWFHWRAMILVTSGLLLLVFSWRAARWTARAVMGIVRRRRLHAARRMASRIQFYCRFEEVLARHGWSRASNQTQYEFAVSAGGQLAESPRTQQAAGLPRRIAEAFYRVRFGQASLDNAEAAAVEQAVSDLAGALDTATNHEESLSRRGKGRKDGRKQ